MEFTAKYLILKLIELKQILIDATLDFIGMSIFAVNEIESFLLYL